MQPRRVALWIAIKRVACPRITSLSRVAWLRCSKNLQFHNDINRRSLISNFT